MSKGKKIAYIGITCLLLANIVRACAPEYNQTGAEVTNNQTPAFNYTEYFENINEQMDKITGLEETKGLNK